MNSQDINKVSIAMCTYNGEKFISEQLDSIMNQTRLPDELIVCDDRSTDRTIEIINTFKTNAPFPVKIIINEVQLGSTKNFEKAIQHCSGDVIFLADQDDVWDFHKISIMESRFVDPKVGMVFTNAEMVDQDLQPLGYSLWESIPFTETEQERLVSNPLDVMIRKNVVTGAAMAFRSSLTDVVFPFTNIWVHDAWIAILISCLRNTKVEIIDKPLIKYRQHANNQLGASKKNLSEQISQAKKKEKKLNINFNEVINQIKEYKIDVTEDTMRKLSEKVKHMEFRNSLPKNALVRAGKVVAEASTLRYNQYSNGYKTILKDLFY
ncbi:glycosyltransferase family 2 protein [Robertmurraya korlensis]|uniref:glycosyltransferase family 2 protein n=1 Tax=Robertmurraya korlensis TaxID=519977 RepID=UPI0008250889|nr:glycosyltransferase family 2 protein [Robertmurraya korlensis]